MSDNLNQTYLRPEAQPLRHWMDMSSYHRKAYVELLEMLNAAVSRLNHPEKYEPSFPPWLFLETRTQLAFLDGIRGSGKTSIMATLAAHLSSESYLRFKRNEQFTSDANSANALDLFNYANEIVRNHLAGRVICVQPLDMEPLPNGTSLLSAILVRILRALSDKRGPEADARRGLSYSDMPRGLVRLRQFVFRIAQAMNTNLQDRRSSLDPEQYAEAVQTLEQQRLQMPRDLDQVLTELSSGIASDTELASHGARPRLLFLIPIDDIDLNPAHCLELLQLLRTFSPPRELFFLLMGQYDLVERSVKIKTAAQFSAIQNGSAALNGKETDDLNAELSRIATLNLRKLIPPFSRVSLPSEVSIPDALHFRPLSPSVADAPDNLEHLLKKALISTIGSQHRPQTLFDLLFPKTDPQHTNEYQDHDHTSWRSYCGSRVLPTTYRQLADLWMDLQKTITPPKATPADRSTPPIRQICQVIKKFLYRSAELDPSVAPATLGKITETSTFSCIERVDSSRLYDRDVGIAGSEIVVQPSKSNLRDNTLGSYRARLRLLKPTTNTGIPLVLLPLSGSTDTKSLPPKHTIQPHSLSAATCSALAVLHDLNYFSCSERAASTPRDEMTSARPVRISWVGPEGIVAEFNWPIPPLPTYLETSQFLSEWFDCLSCCGLTDAQPNNPPLLRASTPPKDSPILRYLKLICGKLRDDGLFRCDDHGTQISSKEVALLAQIWISLGSIFVLQSLDELVLPTDDDIKTLIGEPDNALATATRRCIKALILARKAKIFEREYGHVEHLHKWLRRVIQLLQPEYVTRKSSIHLIAVLDGSSKRDRSRLEYLKKLVSDTLSRQRAERLNVLLQSEKTHLWKNLTAVDEGQATWSISVPEPQVSELGVDRSLDLIRIDVRDLSREVQLNRLRSKILKDLTISPQLGLGDVTGLLNSFESASHQLRTLMKGDGPDPDFFSEFLHSAGLLADAFIKDSAFDAAIKVRQDLVGMSEEFASSLPSDERLQLAALQAEADYGQTLCEAGRWENALPVLQSVTKSYRSLPRDQNLQRIQKQSRALHWLGESLMFFLKWQSAAAAFDEALKLDFRLSQLYPSNQRLIRDYAVSLLKRGDASVEMGRWDHAAMLFSAASILMENRLKNSPDSQETRRDYAVALEKHGLALQQTQQVDRAADQMMKSLDQLKDLYFEADPNDKEICIDILFVAQQLIRLHVQAQDRHKAKSVMSDETVEGIRTRFSRRRFVSLRLQILLLIFDVLELIVLGNPRKKQPELHAKIGQLKDTRIAPEIERQFSFRTAILEFSAIASRGVAWKRTRRQVN